MPLNEKVTELDSAGALLLTDTVLIVRGVGAGADLRSTLQDVADLLVDPDTGVTTWAGLTDKTTADLPADNLPLATALAGKADFRTQGAAITATGNLSKSLHANRVVPITGAGGYTLTIRNDSTGGWTDSDELILDNKTAGTITIAGGTATLTVPTGYKATLAAGEIGTFIWDAVDTWKSTTLDPAGGVGVGTVTTVSVVTANGVSGSVATATTTPAITLTLGAITPSTVNGVTLSGSSTPTLAVSGTTSVSGTNTGNQTITLTSDVTGSGTGSFAATLATVNSNVGTFGSTTKASVVTVNAKGLVTAASESTVVPAVGSITGLGTGVATALAINVGTAGAPVVLNGAGGTPSSLTLTNATGLPIGGSVANTVTALSTSGTVNIDCSLGDFFTLAAAGNVTSITFSNLPGSGKGASKWIQFTQDSTPRTVAWPASFKWAGGSTGAVSTGSGAIDELAITTVDNGTTWKATLAKAWA